MLLQFDGQDARDCLEGCESAREDGTGNDSDRAVTASTRMPSSASATPTTSMSSTWSASTVTLIPTMPGTIRRALLPGCLDQPGTHIE
ncbi:hypothetical protein QNA29_18530 [Rhodococcus opacus]|nr:hypothetical protein [Rhodococcus opacus]MDJ0416403.1 hypothetical protein [Rhodococcus opacus]